MIRKNFQLTITKADRRFKTGVRLFNTYSYYDVDPAWMAEEVRELRTQLYRSADGFALTVEEV